MQFPTGNWSHSVRKEADGSNARGRNRIHDECSPGLDFLGVCDLSMKGKETWSVGIETGSQTNIQSPPVLQSHTPSIAPCMRACRTKGEWSLWSIILAILSLFLSSHSLRPLALLSLLALSLSSLYFSSLSLLSVPPLCLSCVFLCARYPSSNSR